MENIHNQQTQSDPQPLINANLKLNSQKIRFTQSELDMINNIMEQSKNQNLNSSLQSSNNSTKTNSPQKTKTKKHRHKPPKLKKKLSKNIFAEFTNKEDYKEYLKSKEKQFETNKLKVLCLIFFINKYYIHYMYTCIIN